MKESSQESAEIGEGIISVLVSIFTGFPPPLHVEYRGEIVEIDLFQSGSWKGQREEGNVGKGDRDKHHTLQFKTLASEVITSWLQSKESMQPSIQVIIWNRTVKNKASNDNT